MDYHQSTIVIFDRKVNQKPNEITVGQLCLTMAMNSQTNIKVLPDIDDASISSIFNISTYSKASVMKSCGFS